MYPFCPLNASSLLMKSFALLFHMLTDTGFFYVGIVGMFIFTANGSITPAKKLPSLGTKLLFGCLFLLHFIILWGYIASF